MLVFPRDQLHLLFLVPVALHAQHLRHRLLPLTPPFRTHLSVECAHLARQVLADLVRRVVQVARPAEHVQHVVFVRIADLLQIRHATHRKA